MINIHEDSITVRSMDDIVQIREKHTLSDQLIN